MLNFLVIAAVFAVPISSHSHIYTKKSIIGAGRDFSERCRSVSGAVGVDVDFDSLYDAYNECARGVGDYEQFENDLLEVVINILMVRSGSTLHLSDNQKTGIIAFFQTYCPKVIAYMKCDDVVSPIYEKCYTIAERNGTTVGKASWLHLIENICENNVDRLVNIVNTKGAECALSRGYSCFRNYGIPYDPFSNPTLRGFCRFRNMTTDCLGPVVKECELSQTPDTFIESFFSNIKSETLCENVFLNENQDENVKNCPKHLQN